MHSRERRNTNNNKKLNWRRGEKNVNTKERRRDTEVQKACKIVEVKEDWKKTKRFRKAGQRRTGGSDEDKGQRRNIERLSKVIDSGSLHGTLSMERGSPRPTPPGPNWDFPACKLSLKIFHNIFIWGRGEEQRSCEGQGGRAEPYVAWKWATSWKRIIHGYFNSIMEVINPWKNIISCYHI